MDMKIWVENTFEKGEDAGISGEHYAFVFDGLGGTGGMTCRDMAGNARTEAKIASNAAATMVRETIELYWEEWAQQLSFTSRDQIDGFAEQICCQLKQEIDEQLRREMAVWRHDGDQRFMPTTIAGWITFPAPDNKLLAIMIWAGDSRCYVIDEHVMRQTSVDDSDNKPDEDMMAEILSQESPRMNNSIGVDKPYHLNYKCMLMQDAALLFACTDGMYNSVSSPMHLEYYMRMAASGQKDMEGMQTELKSFIEDNILIKDDSATICALGYAPQTGTFEEIDNMLYASVEALEEQYINAFPERPMLPDEDVDVPLRQLSRQLSEMNTFRKGLYKYLERLTETDKEPEQREHARPLILTLRDRVGQKRRQRTEDIERAKHRIALEEGQLRELISTLPIYRETVETKGSDRLTKLYRDSSDYWELSNTLRTQLDNILFQYGNNNWSYYRTLNGKEINYIDETVHDLIVMLNHMLDHTRGEKLRYCFAGYQRTRTVREAMDLATQNRIFNALIKGENLTNDLAPGLKLTLEDMDGLMKHVENIKWYREQEKQARNREETVSLTDVDRAEIDKKYGLLYARQLVYEWYENRQKPGIIELSDNMASQCEERLQRCWAIDEERKAYSRRYAAFAERVKALWHDYLPGYKGWDISFALPEEWSRPASSGQDETLSVKDVWEEQPVIEPTEAISGEEQIEPSVEEGDRMTDSME